MADLKPHSLKKQGIILFLSQVAAFVIHFGTSFILVRLVDKYDFGVFQQFNLLLTTIIPVAGFTLVSSLYFFYPVAGKNEKAGYVFQTYLILCFIALILCLVMFIFKSQLLDILNFQDLKVMQPWLFFSLGFFLASSISDNLFILEKNNIMTALFFPLEKLVYFLFIIGFACYSRDYTGVIIGYFIYSAIKFICITVYLFLNSFRNQVIKLKWGNIKNQIAYCFPFLLANIIFVLSNKFDKLMINQYITPDEFAIYSVAFLSVPFLTNLFSSINNVTIPRLSEHYEKKENEKVVSLYNKLIFTTSSVAIPAVFYFFIMADEVVIFLFTDKYVEATIYYRIYLLIFFFTMTSYGLILRAAKQTKKIFVANAIAGILTIVLGWVLIPKFKMLGAIITASVSMILPAIFQLTAEVTLLKVPFRQIFPVKKLFLLTMISFFAGLLIVIVKLFSISIFSSLVVSSIIYFPLIVLLEYKFDLTPFSESIKNFVSFFNKGNETI